MNNKPLQRALKRLIDVFVSATILTVALPVMVVVALLIRLRMGSPVLFRQQRPGHHERPFMLYKFRTMSDACDPDGNPLGDGERLTSLGMFLRRWSLDELPQFWNVLRGEMSLVGPRPLLMEYLSLYSPQQARRHDVKPGITGWAQVNGRNLISWEDKFALDVWYVEHATLLLDARILETTIRQMFFGKGISAQDHATMPAFRGDANSNQPSITQETSEMQINVLEYLEKTVEKRPNHVCVVDSEGSLSFMDLKNQAQALAYALINKRNVRNRPIGVYMPKGKQNIIGFAAILYSGNCYVPLDDKSPPARLRGILGNIEPELVISTTAHAARLIEAGYDHRWIVCIDDNTESISPEQVALLADRRSRLIDADPVYIINTSGSTGTPKGVVISHRSVLDYIDWAKECYGVDHHTVIGNQAPFHFDNSTLDLYLCFATGATLHIIPEQHFMFPAKLMEYLCQEEINFIFWVPSVLVNIANLSMLDKTTPPPLTKILFAGEVMPTKQLNYWRQRYPRALFSNLYGPTEITVDCTYYIVDRDLSDQEPVPIGHPCRNSNVLLLDGSQPVKPGEPGELCVRGASLALGYWNNPEGTAEAFVQNPLNPHYPDRLYRTGDIVRQNQRGELVFLGRKDSQIKHQGYRIEIGEIENAILALPGIRNACVIYRSKEKQIVAFVESDTPISPAAIRRELLNHIPKYMMPTVFQQMERLPLNTNGKIDRKKLAA